VLWTCHLKPRRPATTRWAATIGGDVLDRVGLLDLLGSDRQEVSLSN